ncbi:MAG: cysteine desulfurase family protein [Candidatus Dormibacteraceae bacterium]
MYLDDAGSARPLAEAIAARQSAPHGNPISLHGEGQLARRALDSARDRAAAVLGVGREGIVFCSSGTEAVNLAILGIGRRLSPEQLIVSWEAEHTAVLSSIRQLQLEGHAVKLLSVDANGQANPADIPENAALVSISPANPEVGTLQPVAEIAQRTSAVGALLHLDCGLAPRWIEPALALADLASFSGHKIGAGSGGLLYANSELRLDPLLYGGPQEWGRRGGYLDVGEAAGIATALEVCHLRRAAMAAAAAPMAEQIGSALRNAGAQLIENSPRLPNFSCGLFANRRGEDLLLALDLAGIAASSGSACASGSLDPSHVLLAMGYSIAEALGSLRFTVGYETTQAEVERAVEVLSRIKI